MSRSQIIDDIGRQIAAEIEEIRKQTETSRVQSGKVHEERLAAIAGDGNRKIRTEEERLRSESLRKLKLERRRIHLALQERVLGIVIDRVEKRLQKLRNDPEYPDLLRAWTIEAAIGLGYGSEDPNGTVGAPRTRLRCEQSDLDLVASRIARIQDEFRELTGRELRIELDSAGLAEGTSGIMLFDESGRTVFSNTVADRIRRAMPDIQNMVMERLFPGGSE